MAEREPKPAPGVPDSSEFFYIDGDTKTDTDLHETIIRQHDYPIDEKIMKPIRERNRAKYNESVEAERKATRLKSQWAREKRRALELLKHYPGGHDHDQMTHGHGGGGGSDSDSKGDSRKAGEDDKTFAKRVVDKRPAPKELPEKHSDYFKMKRATVIPIDKLVSSKSDEENRKGGDNGAKRMAAAAKGELSKRAPLSVEPITSGPNKGKYLITDGNGTYTSVKDYGWKAIPVKVHVQGYKPGVRAEGPDAVSAYRDNGWVSKSPIKTMDQAVDASLISQENLQDAATPIANKLGIKFINPGTKVHSTEKDKYGNAVRDAEGHPVYAKDANGNPKRKEEGIARVLQKMKPGQTVARISDFARATFTLNAASDGDEVVKELSKTYEVADEGWRTIKDSFYSDRPLLLRDPETGQVAEVQLAHPGMLHAKEHGGHVMYESQREAADAAKKAQAAGDRKEQERQTKISEEWNEKMRAYYGPILDDLPPEWKLIDRRK